jgi:methyl-accepting chemotaxis protein
MFKTLTARAIVPVAVAVTGFVIICCILLYSVMKSDMIEDAVKYETNLADTIIKSTHYAMLKSDRDMLKNIIDNIGVQQGVEHVRIFNKIGLIMFSGKASELNRYMDKKTAGCIGCHAGDVPTATLGSMERARRFTDERGIEVLAITAPIFNEPACFTAPCHVHSNNLRVLGTLDIGFSTSPLQKTLSVMRSRMMLFSFMVLILTIGGVAALLRRNVFDPLREIREFTASVNFGDLDASLPEISGELSDLAEDVQSVALKLRNALNEIDQLRGSPGQVKEK